MNVFKVLITAMALISLMDAGEALGAAASNMTQTVGGGGVTIKVTYLNPRAADDPRFQIVLDTHPVNLDAYDFKSIAVLSDDAGKGYVPGHSGEQGQRTSSRSNRVFPKTAAGNQANRIDDQGRGRRESENLCLEF